MTPSVQQWKLARFLANAEQSKNRGSQLTNWIFVTSKGQMKTWDSAKGRKKVRVVNQEIKRITKNGEKKSWIYLHCQGIVDNIKKNISEKAYQLLKVLTKRKQGEANTIRDKNGNCLAEAQDILTR